VRAARPAYTGGMSRRRGGLSVLSLGVVLPLGLGLAPPVGADFQAGQRAYARGELAAAFREWRAAAEAGDAAAQYHLGMLYRDGKGIRRDTLEWAHWWWRAAQGGHPEARRAVAWPFTPADAPRLACTPGRLPGGPTDQLISVDHVQAFDFVVTLSNTRLVIEQMVLAGVVNYDARFLPARPNLVVLVYRIDGDRRTPVPRRLYHSGGGGGGSGPYGDEGRREHFRDVGPSEDSAFVSLRLPLDEAERRRYRDKFLDELAKQPTVTADDVRRAREAFEHPDGRHYWDSLLPSPPGVYEIECRYGSRDPRFWPGRLVAPPLRFQFVKRTEWIELLRGGRSPGARP
jgi:hypothetical protein